MGRRPAARAATRDQAIIHRLPPTAEFESSSWPDGCGAGEIDPPRRGRLLGGAFLDAVPPSFRCPWEHGVPIARRRDPRSMTAARASRPRDQWTSWVRDHPLIYVTFGTIFNDRPGL